MKSKQNNTTMKTTTTQKLKAVILYLALSVGFKQHLQSQTHFLKFACPAYTCNIRGESKSASYAIAPIWSLFDSITTLQNGDVLIQFRYWKAPGGKLDSIEVENRLNLITNFNTTLSATTQKNKIAEYKLKLKSQSRGGLLDYCLIGKEDFAARASQKALKQSKFTFKAGTLAIPFKIRLQPFDFSKDVTLAGTAAASYEFTKKFTSSFVGGIGISSIGIDSTNTRGKTKKTTNLSAFTISGGVLFAWTNLNVTINVGSDFLGNADKNVGWIYDKKIWVGVGIGYNLFDTGKSDDKIEPKDSGQ
jgi:hypothetical protein